MNQLHRDKASVNRAIIDDHTNIMNAKKVKIIVTASTYPRWKDDAVPMFVHDQLVFLKKNYPEFEITVLAPHHPGAKVSEIAIYGEIIRFKYFFPAKLQKLVYPAIMPNLRENRWLYLQIPFLIFFEFIALFLLVLKRKPDFIYSHWFIPQGIVGGVVGLLTRTKHVYTSHSSDVKIAKKIPVLGPALVRFFSAGASKITVVSQRSLRQLRHFFTATTWDEIAHKVKVIPMGVDTSSFAESEYSVQELKEKYGYHGRNILLFIGRLAEKKGVTYLLDALSEYVKTDPNTVLVIAGDGTSLAPLKSQTAQLNLEQYVDFVGYTIGEKKLELFKISDILLLPSIITDDGDAEGFPVVLMEGLAAGKICIATDVSGADDVLESGKDGFLIPQKSSQQILQSLLTIRNLSDNVKKCISRRA
ncbi:MAG: glycosyltransferase family 4 protein [Gammaproteobacteria bacterium]|nr:glycosyltransferase family 4 protein [Gammaproteobacteria bacterium]